MKYFALCLTLSLSFALTGCATTDNTTEQVAENKESKPKEKECRPQSIGSRVRSRCNR